MLISGSIPNLINGVSQQPHTLRLASQGEVQTNFYSSVADGLKRRPGTRHVAKINAFPWTDVTLHTINRDHAEKYLVAIRPSGITIYDAKTGAPKTVNAPSGWGYLSAGATNIYRAVTVADYTFIVNRGVVTSMAPALSTLRNNQAAVHVRAGNYSREYRVTILRGTDAPIIGVRSTPDGTNVAHAQEVRPTEIVVALKNALTTAITAAGADYTVGIKDDQLLIASPGGSFTVQVSDDAGGVNMIALGEKTQRFSDLPKTCFEGFSTEIAGDNTSRFDNYFVKYNAGVWKETLKGGEKYRFNASTMPHVLIREADGTFTFKPAAWEDRVVGDEERTPPPSFIGRTISDVFFHRNRLGLLSDENVILSKSGGFFDFWRDTATTVIDSDPIDIAIPSPRVSNLTYAIPFNKVLILFSEGAQFVMESGETLSAQTASVVQATEFESSVNVRPVAAGRNIYFPAVRGNFSLLREYFQQPDNGQEDAPDVTSHAPQYLPKDLFKLAASTSENVLVALSSGQKSSMWVYKFYFGEQGKLQSSWSRWDFDAAASILSAEFLNSDLYMVTSRKDGVYIESMGMESGALDADATYHYHVDRGYRQTGGYYDGTQTTFALRYETSEPLWVFAAGGDTLRGEGTVLNHTMIGEAAFSLPGDQRGRPIFVGVRMTSTYEFSKFFLRTTEGGGTVAVDSGRTQLRRMELAYAASGYFRIVVKSRGREAVSRVFSGIRLGASSGTLGSRALADGRFSFPLMGRNHDITVEITTDNFLPCSFTSAEWTATYHSLARRM